MVPVMRVAVAQFSVSGDKAENQTRISRLAEEAARAGTRLAVFPECAMVDLGASGGDLRGSAEPLDGPFVESLARLAERLELTLVAGIFETVPGEPRVHNTAVVLDPRRGLVAAYRKRNLYDAFGERESDKIRPGSEEPPVFEVDGFTAAVVVCYDLRFPSFIERLVDRGAELLLVPAAWVAGPLKEDHWKVLVRARAIENTIYVAGAGQSGVRYCGLSRIVDPMGVVRSSLGEAEGVTTADVSKERLAEVRARLPLLVQRRAAAEVTTQS
jgi:deaminated glutathione amidase